MLLFFLMALTSQLLHHDDFAFLPTYTCFDAFALGGLFSWFRIYKPHLVPTFYKYARVFGAVSVVIIFCALIEGHWYFLPKRTIHSFAALWLLTHIVIKYDNGGAGDGLKWLFRNKLLILTGRISYGLYVYHIFIPKLTSYVLEKYSSLRPAYFKDWPNNAGFFCFNLLVLFLCAWLSWTLIEKPVLKFKKYFIYPVTSPVLKKRPKASVPLA